MAVTGCTGAHALIRRHHHGRPLFAGEAGSLRLDADGGDGRRAEPPVHARVGAGSRGRHALRAVPHFGRSGAQRGAGGPGARAGGVLRGLGRHSLGPCQHRGAHHPGETTMAEAAATGKPVAATSRTAAVTFVGLVAALHFIEPQIDPSWRMVSDYEIGRHGYVMVLAVLSSACTLS